MDAFTDSNNIAEGAVDLLALGLEKSRCVRTLNLRIKYILPVENNKINDAGATRLAEALRRAKTIQVFNVSMCIVGRNREQFGGRGWRH